MRLRVRRLQRRPDTIDDDAEGLQLVTLVRRALQGGAAPTVAVVIRAQGVDIVELAPLIRAGASLKRFLAALSRSTAPGGPPEAVGVIGRVRSRDSSSGPRVPEAMVFLEWSDCRWWHWRALLESDGLTLRDGTETVRSAVEGDRMPPGIGRWWSLGRRLGLKAQLTPVAETSSVVH